MSKVKELMEKRNDVLLKIGLYSIKKTRFLNIFSGNG